MLKVFHAVLGVQGSRDWHFNSTQVALQPSTDPTMHHQLEPEEGEIKARSSARCPLRS